MSLVKLFTKAELSQNPSVKDGISIEEQKTLRRQYSQYMMHVGALLELRASTIAIAVYYWLRCYATVSLKAYDPDITARAAILLALKVEEDNKPRIRDIMNTAHRARNPSQPPLTLGKEYSAAKDLVVEREQLLMRIVGYNLEYRSPLHYVLHICRHLEGSDELANLAFYILNDSMCTTLWLQYRPEAVACSALYLAGEMIREQLSRENGAEWWSRFNVARLELEDICNQLLDVLEVSNPEPLPEAKLTTTTMSVPLTGTGSTGTTPTRSSEGKVVVAEGSIIRGGTTAITTNTAAPARHSSGLYQLSTAASTFGKL